MSQSLLIQGRFQLLEGMVEERILEGDLVAIPSDSGQVSTSFLTGRRKGEFVLVAIPSDSGQVSTIYLGFIARSGMYHGSQSLLIQGRFQLLNTNTSMDCWKNIVAIPSDSGQVSTRRGGGRANIT